MKKAVKNTFIILLFFFAFVGVIASIYIAKELYFEAKFNKLYIQNCQKVKVGMSLEEAKIIMGGKNFSENERSFTYWTSFEKGKPKDFYLDYHTSGSSYNTVIHYNPITGLVTQVECYGY